MLRVFKSGLTDLLMVVVSLLLVSVVATNGYSAKRPYVLGAILAITGVFGFIGSPEAKTIPLMIDPVNKAGGINGHLLKVIVYNDEANPTKGRLDFIRLVTKDHVLAIFGPSSTPDSLSVAPLAKRYKIPLITMAPDESIVRNPRTGRQRKWVFKVPQSNSLVVQKEYTFMKKKGITRVAIMTSNSSFGIGGAKTLIKYASKYGIKIVAHETYGVQDTNLTVPLMKIKATNAQALVNWSGGPTMIIATKQWKQLGLSKKMLLFQSHAFGNLKYIKLAGGAAEGVYVALGKVNLGWLLPASDPQKKPIMAYAKDYEKHYGVWPPSFGGHAVDSLSLLIDALKAVGPNRAKIRYYIEHKKDYIGMHGIYNFSPSNHGGLTKETSLAMVEVKNGTWSLVH